MNEPFRSQPESMEPLLPSLRRRELEALAWTLNTEAAALGQSLNIHARAAIAQLLRLVNSYYSNLIEGHATLPADIERAYRRDYSNDPQRRNLQLEAKAHVEVERRMRARLSQPPKRSPSGASIDPAPVIADRNFLTWLHRAFFARLPDDMRVVIAPDGSRRNVVPGELRTEQVEVGQHLAPAFAALPAFLKRFEEAYRLDRLSPTDRVIAAAASHHRILWIHPFLDGNGRVARLFTEGILLLSGVDGEGLWSVSRGLARKQQEYKRLLAAADDERRGDLDGRGSLSDRALADFCVFFLEQAVDQVRFIQGLLDVKGLQDRVERYLVAERDARRLPPRAPDLILSLLVRGRLERGEALRLLGGAERTARNHLATLLDTGLVVADGTTHRAPIRWAVPTAAGLHYFPNLFPAAPDQQPLDGEGGTSFIHKLRSMSDDAQREAIDDLLADHVPKLADDEAVSGSIAETNAAGFYVDDYSDVDIDLFDDDEARVSFHFHMSGDHDQDRMFSGDEIHGSAVLVIDTSGTCSFDEVRAERVDDYERDEVDDWDPGLADPVSDPSSPERLPELDSGPSRPQVDF